MAYAVRVHAYGGPEVLTYEDVDGGEPGPGEVLLKQHAVGVNFIDIYQRDGLYKLPSLPAIPSIHSGLPSNSARLPIGVRSTTTSPSPSLHSARYFS